MRIATFVAAAISKVVCSVAIVFFLYLALTGTTGAYFGAALFGFILFAGDAEYRNVKNQDQIEAHWHKYGHTQWSFQDFSGRKLTRESLACFGASFSHCLG